MLRMEFSSHMSGLKVTIALFKKKKKINNHKKIWIIKMSDIY